MNARTPLVRIYALILIVIMGGIAVTAPFSVGFGTLFPHFALLIKSWKEILMGIALILAVIIVTRRGLWHELARDWVLRLIAAFALLHIVLLAWHWRGAMAAAAGLLIDLRFVLFFTLIYILLRVTPTYRIVLLIISAIGAEVVVIFGALQLFLPRDILSHIGYGPKTILPYMTVDKNPNYIRINSTLRGPNPLGAYAGIVLTVLVSIVARQPQWLKSRSRQLSFSFVTICTLVTLWISYSRSALIGAVVAVVIVGAVVWRKWLQRNWKAVVEIGIVVLFLAIFIISQGGFAANVIRHNNPGTGAKVTSDDAHLSSLKAGMKEFITQPLGDGIGSTGSASLFSDNGNIIENQYFFVAHESGWLGLGLFVAILLLVLRRAWRDRRDWLALAVFASGLGLLIIGVLLPVFADDTVSIIWWGLAGIVYAGVQSKHNEPRKSSHKKRT